MSRETTSPGASDAQLVRYLDDELDAEDRARVEAAVEADAALAARLETLRRRGRTLHGLLAATDPPVPARTPPGVVSIASAPSKREAQPPTTWLLRAAAVILVLAGVVSLVPPLRAWVVESLQRLAGTASEMVPPPPPPLLAAPDTMNVDFAHEHTSFDVELIATQPEGRVRIRIADVERASAEIHTRTAAEELFPIPAGIRFINTPTSVADYEVTVPSVVRIVRIIIAGRRIAEYPALAPENRERIFELKR